VRKAKRERLLIQVNTCFFWLRIFFWLRSKHSSCAKATDNSATHIVQCGRRVAADYSGLIRFNRTSEYALLRRTVSSDKGKLCLFAAAGRR
jgi:hypothetical protein